MTNTDTTKPKILVITSTVRESRAGIKIANWYMTEVTKLTQDLDFELYDIKDLNLPLFNESKPPMSNQYSAIQQSIADKLKSADGFVFITGEYNHSIPGSLKNFLDYIFYEWNYKAAAYVGYGSAGGVRSIEHLIQVMTELKVVSVANAYNNIHIPIFEVFDESGNIMTDKIKGDISKQLTDFTWWVKALKNARQN